MKILVTGATGFIGSHLITELLKSHHEIIATAIEKKENVKTAWIGKVTYIEHDLNDRCEDLYELFQRPDRLIHLSWESLPNYKGLFHFEKNLFTSYFLIKDLVQKGLKDVTVLGTCLEYGMQNGQLSENMATMPSNPYALAKDTLRRFLEELEKHYPFDLKWIRLFYLFGEGQNKNSILEQLKKAVSNNETEFNMSGGEQLRDYLPVEKAAEYIAVISLQNKVTGIINCCSGKPVSLKKFVEDHLRDNNINIKLNLGHYPYPDHEPMEFWGDDTKLQQILRNRNESTD